MTIHIPNWDPPYPAHGDFDFVRVSSSHLSGRGCAEKFAYGARPAVWADDYVRPGPSAVASFPLGTARDAAARLLKDPDAALADPTAAVDAVLGDVLGAAREEWPPESIALVTTALTGYLTALADLAASGEMPTSLVFTDVVIAEQDNALTAEFFAWGLHHYVDGGALRETHILRLSNAASVRLSDASIALAAHAIANGIIAEPKTEPKHWKHPFDPISHQPPQAAERVRVRVIGMSDASHDVRFDGTAQQAAQMFAREVQAAASVYAGGAFHPSKYCTSCKVVHNCPTLNRIPGLLGVAGYSPVLRSLSPSDLWMHANCARQLHLAQDLGIPRVRQSNSPSQHRGRQIHQWLEAAHRRGQACSHADLPDPDMSVPGASVVADAGIATDLGWTSDEYVTNRRFLLQHLDVCLYAAAEPASVVVEFPITAMDTEANVIVSTTPDAIYLAMDSGGTVMRETKTVDARFMPTDDYGLLEKFPQIALAVCLLADGFDPLGAGTSPATSRVELEMLSVTHHSLVTFDVSKPVTVLQARSALAQRVDRWMFDDEHPVGDRPPCGRCPVADACGRSTEPALTDSAVDYLHGLSPQVGGDVWGQEVTDQMLADAVGLVMPPEEEEFPF